MNTITIQLNDRQLADLEHLIDEGLDTITSRYDNGEYLESPEDVPRLADEGITEIRQAIENRTYLWSFGCIHLDIPSEVIDKVARSGDNLPAAEAALQEHPCLAKKLESYSSEVLAAAIFELDVNGIEQVHNMNIRTMHQYILWSACWDIANKED